MIKIIKNPNPKTAKTWITKCYHCCCEFTYQDVDIYNNTFFRTLESPHVFCPNCEKAVWASKQNEYKSNS